MTKKILVLTEATKGGSGYTNLMLPLLDKLDTNDYEIRIIGIGYDGWEYNYNFSLTGVASVSDGVMAMLNISKLWKPDFLIVGMDIPHHIKILEQVKVNNIPAKYIAITPLENPPLTQSWAAALMLADHVLFISELGEKSAKQSGLLKAGHLQVAANIETFYPASKEERGLLRKDLGFDEFVILSVADNQERKNLWATLDIIHRLKEKGRKVKLVLVTRENSPSGHNLRDLCTTLDINQEVLILERGIPEEELRKLYVASDLYLSTTKAEGLGIPVIEAMSCGLPVVATNTGAMTELLTGRGILVDPEYTMTDVWGNSKRDFIDRSQAVERIIEIMEHGKEVPYMKLVEYAQSRTMDIPVMKLVGILEGLSDEKASV